MNFKQQSESMARKDFAEHYDERMVQLGIEKDYPKGRKYKGTEIFRKINEINNRVGFGLASTTLDQNKMHDDFAAEIHEIKFKSQEELMSEK